MVLSADSAALSAALLSNCKETSRALVRNRLICSRRYGVIENGLENLTGYRINAIQIDFHSLGEIAAITCICHMYGFHNIRESLILKSTDNGPFFRDSIHRAV